jgi:hypothetical protein
VLEFVSQYADLKPTASSAIDLCLFNKSVTVLEFVSHYVDLKPTAGGAICLFIELILSTRRVLPCLGTEIRVWGVALLCV